MDFLHAALPLAISNANHVVHFQSNVHYLHSIQSFVHYFLLSTCELAVSCAVNSQQQRQKISNGVLDFMSKALRLHLYGTLPRLHTKDNVLGTGCQERYFGLGRFSVQFISVGKLTLEDF